MCLKENKKCERPDLVCIYIVYEGLKVAIMLEGRSFMIVSW